jgi:hypothetical protein
VAVPVFVLSLVGIFATAVFTFMLVGMVPSMMLSLLVGAALLWYSTIARRSGWLG